jgi:hypothetical protein
VARLILQAALEDQEAAGTVLELGQKDHLQTELLVRKTLAVDQDLELRVLLVDLGF